MPCTLSGEFGFVIWGLLLGVRDREAANAGVASAPGIRQRFGGSTAQPGRTPQERRGGAHSRLSRSVDHDSEVSEEVTPPSRGTRPSGPSRGGRCGSGDRGSCCWTDWARGEGPLAQGPSRSRTPAWAPVAGHWSAPGGWARCLRPASGSVGLCWCKANEGALLLCRHVWSWRGARRARGEHSTDGHKTGWADVRREPAARES